MIRCKNHERISATIRERVPPTPGVYLFYDADGRINYIGKSINLRDRMLSYFRQGYHTVEARIGQMIRSIEDFDYFATDTELQALLMEDELIKEMLPEHNVRQKQYEEYRYVLLTCDSYPALKMIENPSENKKGTVFGPYRDRYFVAKLLDLVYHCFHVRSCTDPVPVGQCMNYEIGKCRGPCRDAISRGDYWAIIEQVTDFLNGSDMHVMTEIVRDMEHSASRRLYEKASTLRNRLDFCRRFTSRQHFIYRFKSERFKLTEKRDKRVTHHFDKGRWIAGRIQMSTNSRKMGSMSERTLDFERDPRFIIDRANIVYTWINKNESECEYCFD